MTCTSKLLEKITTHTTCNADGVSYNFPPAGAVTQSLTYTHARHALNG